MGNAAAGLTPNFGAGRCIVRVGIAMIMKLVRLKSTGDFTGESRGDAIIRFGRFIGHIGRRDDDFGTVGAQRVDFFFRHFVGHDQNATVAANRPRP